MKKSTILSLLVFAIISISQKANAQTSSLTSGEVTVNINLSTDVLSINLTNMGIVQFDYLTAGDYLVSKTVPIVGQFTVVSNRNYSLSVKALSEFTSTTSDPLPLNLVTVNVDPLTLNGGALPSSATTLSMAGTTILTNASPNTNAVYNINYTIPNATSLISLAREEYTTKVTYTATHI